MSARGDLLDSLTAERYAPIPPHVPPDRTGGPDTPGAQQRRVAALLAETAPARSPRNAEDTAPVAEPAPPPESERERLRRLMPGRTPKEPTP